MTLCNALLAEEVNAVVTDTYAAHVLATCILSLAGESTWMVDSMSMKRSMHHPLNYVINFVVNNRLLLIIIIIIINRTPAIRAKAIPRQSIVPRDHQTRAKVCLPTLSREITANCVA